MFALFLTTLFIAAAAIVAGVLADSGLRWWSAFGALRRELKGDAAPMLPNLRPAVAIGGYSGFERSGCARSAGQQITRAA